MKHSLFLLPLLAAGLTLLTGASFLPFEDPRSGHTTTDNDEELQAMISAIDDQQLIGQLLMFGFKGTDPQPGIELINELAVGNLIIMKNNYADPQQLQDATNALQSAALARNGCGLLISVDQEGGAVNRITGDPVVVFESAAVLGKTLDPQWGRAIGEATGQQLSALGINLVLAPVVDVEVDPRNYLSEYGRCFGDDPQLVGQWGAAFIQGFERAGVASCAKHYPGYAADLGDPHKDAALNPANLALLHQREFPPFSTAIAAGVPCIMTAHVALPNVTGSDTLPATFSSLVLEDLLRGELGFEGLVITDDMNMQSAVTADPAELPLLAMQGGCDVYLLVQDLEKHRQVAAVLLSALEDGSLPRNRVEASVLRVLRVKQRYGLLNPALPGPAELAAHIGPELYETLPGRKSHQ